MKKNYANGFMGEGLDRKKRYGVGGMGESFLQPTVKKKEEEEYSPELKEFFKTGDTSVLQKSIAQTVLKDRIAQEKKDNEGINRLSVWGKYNQPEEKARGKVKVEGIADRGVYAYKPKDKEEVMQGAYPYQGKKGVEQWEEKKKPTPQLGQESWWEESEKKEEKEKPFKAMEHWKDENRGVNKVKGYVDGFKEDKGNKQKSYFEDILEAKSKRDKERGERARDSVFPIKDVVPSEVKLTQEEWDGLEDFEKEWTIEGTHRQMAKDRELQEMKGILPVSESAENKRQNLRSGGDMTEIRGDVKAKKTEEMSEDIEKDYRMGYNGDVEVDKRNPQHYRKSAEEQQEFFKEKAKQKYNDETVIIHTGTESPEDSIDPEDGKVHVWVNPDGVQKITKEDGTVVEVSDPNIKIFESNKIRNELEKKAIMNTIRDSKEFKQNEAAYPRNMDSYLIEWDRHNLAYGFLDFLGNVTEMAPNLSEKIREQRDRAKDVDLDTMDPLGAAWDMEMYKKYLEAKRSVNNKGE